MSDLIRVSGLWKNKSGKGLSGNLTATTRLLILPNDRKEKDSHPDYYLFIAPKERKDGPEAESDDMPF